MNNKIKHCVLIPFIISSLLCFATENAPTKSSYPPRIVTDGKLLPFKDPLKDKTIVAHCGEGVELTKNGIKRNVNTCSEYFRAIDEGFSPFSTFDIANESFFKSGCAQLSWFPKVKPAAVSFIHDFRFTKNILAQLPPCFLFGDSYIGNQIKIGLKEGSSLHALDSTYKITSLKPLMVNFESNYDVYSLDILGFGDFTGSGYEEMLVFASSHSKTGSLGSYNIYIFSKKAGDSILRVANSDDGNWCPSNMNAVFKGCSADRLNEIRLKSQKLFAEKKYEESETLLNNFHNACYSSLGWPQQLWLTSDLMITRYHLGEYDSCLNLLETQNIEKAREFNYEPKAKNAILHNKKLCLARK